MGFKVLSLIRPLFSQTKKLYNSIPFYYQKNHYVNNVDSFYRYILQCNELFMNRTIDKTSFRHYFEVMWAIHLFFFSFVLSFSRWICQGLMYLDYWGHHTCATDLFMLLLRVCLDNGFHTCMAESFKLATAEEGLSVSAKMFEVHRCCTKPVHTASDVCLHYADPSTSLCPQIHFQLCWSDWSQLLGSRWLTRADLIYLFT